MNQMKLKRVSLLLIAIVAPVLTPHAVAAGKPWWVTELKLSSPPVCDSGSWSYKVSWRPIIWESRPWPKYFVKGNGCGSATYTCGTDQCIAQISSCSLKMAGSWTGVTADIGQSVSGVRVGGAYKPTNCR